jgi:hypothetical protein
MNLLAVKNARKLYFLNVSFQGKLTGVRDIYAKVYNSELKEYPDILKTKPEKHANRVRENGKRATIVRVMSARENGTKRAKTAPGTKSTTR